MGEVCLATAFEAIAVVGAFEVYFLAGGAYRSLGIYILSMRDNAIE